jgi:hypothetical protein
MQRPAKSLGSLISGIHNTRDMEQSNKLVCTPFLNRKMLDINMPTTRRRFILIDHGDGGQVAKNCS